MDVLEAELCYTDLRLLTTLPSLGNDIISDSCLGFVHWQPLLWHAWAVPADLHPQLVQPAALELL